MGTDRQGLAPWPVVVHSARTAAAVLASLFVAWWFHLSEAYWAPITTIVITQSSLGAAVAVSWERFIGTLVGAVLGAIAASYFGPSALVFGVCVFALGLVCAVVRVDRSAYRFGGVTLAIVLLIPREGRAWQVAVHRFAEVSIGIVTALIFATVWPEKEEIPSEGKLISSQAKSGSDQIRAGS
jgi:uncharacterized membrane protein YccC